MLDRDFEHQIKAEAQIKAERHQEKQLYADQVNANTCDAPQAQCGGALGKEVFVADSGPLNWQLREKIYDLERKHQRTARALDILTRHPEFSEFLELQQLINSGVQY